MKKIIVLKYIFLCMIVSQSFFAQTSKHKKNKYNFVVAQDGSGDYKTVQEAFDAVPKLKSERSVIFVKNGIYKQVITLETDKNNVTLIGEDVDKVVLTYDNYSSKINPVTNKGYGTSGSSS